MRKLLLITLFVFSINSFAQTTIDYKKFTILVSAGASVPVQAYGKKTFNTLTTRSDTANITGFANTGVNISLSVSYKFSKKVGIMLQAAQSINQFNNNAYANAINNANSGFGRTTQYTAQNITSSPHYIGQYLVGPCFSFPLEDNVSFEAHALLGEITAIYPKVFQTQTGGPDDIKASTKYNNGSGFGYSVGMGLKCMFNKYIGIQLTAAYVGSKINYQGFSSSYTDTQTRRGFTNYIVNYNYSSTTNSRYMSLGIINITGGLAFSF